MKNSIRHHEAVAGHRARSLQLVGRHLDNRETPQRAHEAAGGHAAARFHDPPGARHDEDVDRKPHEERVHHVRGRDDERVARRERITPQQAPLARSRIERAFEGRGDGQTGPLVDQPEWTAGSPQQRTEKVRLQLADPAYGIPLRMIGIRMRYLTGNPFSMAGLNFHALAAATSIRS